MKTDADNIVRNHVVVSMGVGLIPLPIVDVVVLIGVQLNMLRKLSKIYNIPFSKDKGKHFIAALMGSGIPVSLSGSAASLVKAIPIIGQTSGILTMVALAGAGTYAVGKVFIQHFESGGTFLDFDPEKVKEYYSQMLKEGEKITADIKNGNTEKKEDITADIKNGNTEKKEDIAAVPEKKDEEKISSAESEKNEEPIKKDTPQEPIKEEAIKKDTPQEPIKNGDKKKQEKENTKAGKNDKTGKIHLNYPQTD